MYSEIITRCYALSVICVQIIASVVFGAIALTPDTLPSTNEPVDGAPFVATEQDALQDIPENDNRMVSWEPSDLLLEG